MFLCDIKIKFTVRLLLISFIIGIRLMKCKDFNAFCRVYTVLLRIQYTTGWNIEQFILASHNGGMIFKTFVAGVRVL